MHYNKKDLNLKSFMKFLRFLIYASRKCLLKADFSLIKSAKYSEMTSIIIVSFLFFSPSLSAQNVNRADWQVKQGNDIRQYAWAGGLNAPQFSAVDLNNDGLLDIYIFDREGNAQLTFINNGTAGQSDYSFAPKYAAHFPPLLDWCLMRDYNGDGAGDIFAAAFDEPIISSIAYTGKFVNNELTFERYNFNWMFNVITVEVSGAPTNTYVSFEDLPDVNDVDGDGDMDILAFSTAGKTVTWYKNQSQEMGFDNDSLIYVIGDLCWGKFEEAGLSSNIFLSDDPNKCYEMLTGPGDPKVRHAGSTLLTYDNDNDGDREIILGDLNSLRLVMLTNGGSKDNAWMTAQDTFFPGYDIEADMSIFLGAFHLDINNDGKRDLLVAPNGTNAIENVENVWLYENNGTDNAPVFNFEQSNFMVEEMLDFGTGAHPALVDYNADGLLDIVVGNWSYFVSGGVKDARLALLENTGTATQPAFELVDDDWLNFSQYSNPAHNFTPTFGDMDDDGDMDMLVGENSGSFFYLENTAGAGNPIQYGTPIFPYMNIDLPQAPTPQIIDLNRDGLKDIVTGLRQGVIVFFPNIGTASIPAFESDHTDTTNIIKLGDFSTDENGDTEGYCAPFFVDIGTDFMLFSGSDWGGLYKVSDIENNLDSGFIVETMHFGNIREGSRMHPVIADIDSDGILDMIIGNHRGGLSAFSTGLNMNGMVNTKEVIHNTLDFDVYPNPASKELQITLASHTPATVSIYNILGQSVLANTAYMSETSIDISHLSTGIYFVHVQQGQQVGIRKWLKKE